MDIAKYIDHTLLRADASKEDIIKICEEAKKFNFYSVCLNSSYVSLAKKSLEGSEVKICSVIGFPLGMMTKETKVFEAKNAVENGADEIDMVMNVGLLKDGKEDEVYQEIKEIKEAIGDRILKVIIETCYLTNKEKIKACELSIKANADFVKTSTGFGTGGATFQDVDLMLKVVDGKAKVKASGGVRDIETAKEYIELGVSRLGTSSGVKLVQGDKIEGDY